METWDLWFPGGAATGLPFARARIDRTDVVLAHAVPRALQVDVRDANGQRRAFAERLERDGAYVPMTRLRIEGPNIHREDIWPAAEDIGRVVILPGGEAGLLKSWWNADDGSEWRWQIEFYNRRSIPPTEERDSRHEP
jgi:hypothetical protein